MAFKIKLILAQVFDILGITNYLIRKLDDKYNNQYIRIINYHNTLQENKTTFEKQLQWYEQHYININYEQFRLFMRGKKLSGEKPGLMLTFDDGLAGNYNIAFPLLKKYGFTGYFMCSSDLVGKKGYMDVNELNELIRAGHIVGNHTATHHRMRECDTNEILTYEIVESKKILENMLNVNIDIFCWCGGEEEHYTSKAYKMIKSAGYMYGFMTNSYPVTSDTDRMKIQRINVEDSWPIHLVKFQVSGFMDKYFEKKRKRVNQKMN